MAGKLATIMEQIYEIFEPQAIKGFKKSRIFVPQLDASHMTIRKARAFLGIGATVVAGRHVWLAPQVPLEKAMIKAFPAPGLNNKKRKKLSARQIMEEDESKLSRPQVLARRIFEFEWIQKIMLEFKCKAREEEVIKRVEEEAGRTYGWSTYSYLRKLAGIEVKNGYWLYPAPQVEEWLYEMLVNSKNRLVKWSDIVERSPFAPEILRMFRKGHGVGITFLHGKEEWYLLDRWAPPARDEDLEESEKPDDKWVENLQAIGVKIKKPRQKKPTMAPEIQEKWQHAAQELKSHETSGSAVVKTAAQIAREKGLL